MMGLRSVVFNAGGREIYDRDIEGIQEVTRVCGGLSRKELAHTVCDHLSWVTASGRHKIDACMKLLKKLEAMGTIVLPAKQEHKPPPRIIISPKSRTAPRAAVCGELSDVGEVTLTIASVTGDKDLWNEYVDRYHMLGYKRPFGCRIRYFIVSPKGELGCILLAGAAKSMGARDEWIGWSDKTRLKNLPWFEWINRIEYRFGSNLKKRIIVHVVVCQETWEEIDPETSASVTKTSRHAWLSSKPLNRYNVHER
jgi:hypothetical protein